jgi:hypothetical protein
MQQILFKIRSNMEKRKKEWNKNGRIVENKYKLKWFIKYIEFYAH